MFLIKSEKENGSGSNTFSNRRKRTLGFTLPLKPAWVVAGSLTVGPSGPLVRFDQSPAPSFSSGRAEAELRRLPPTNGGSPRDSEAGMDPPVQGGPPAAERVMGTKGVAGGELHGGWWPLVDWGLGLWWFPIVFERWGGSVMSRGRGWEHGRG